MCVVTNLALLKFGFACWVRFGVHGGTPKKNEGNQGDSEDSEDSSQEMATEVDPLMGTLLGGLMVGGEGKANQPKAKAKGTQKKRQGASQAVGREASFPIQVACRVT